MKKNAKILKFTVVFFLLFSVPYMYFVYTGMGEFQENTNVQSIKSIEKAIEKAAVLCYAIEGSYPPDVEYLADHYGIIVDDSKYFYYYEVNGSNILPKISVFKRW